MKRMALALTFLLAMSGAVSAQFTPSKKNLHGLTGVRLIVMFGNCPSKNLSNCAQGLDEAQRPELLKVVEAEATTKLENAGIPVFGLADKRNLHDAKLVLLVTLDKPNGFIYPVVTELKLLQRVRLVRDPSIEYDAMTWSREGVGGPNLEISRIRRLVATLVEQFIGDYLSVNPKQSASSGNDKPGNTKH